MIKDTKICSKCKKTYPKSKDYFYPCYLRKDSLSSQCKNCNSEYGRIRNIKESEKLKIKRKERFEDKKRRGTCTQCNEKPITKCLCEKHLLMRISRKYFKTSKYWEFLKNLWIKQNKKCVYSEEDIILGKNASIDHIIPCKPNSLLYSDINNVQWVTVQINRVKNNLSHEDFVTLCHKISVKFFE